MSINACDTPFELFDDVAHMFRIHVSPAGKRRLRDMIDDDDDDDGNADSSKRSMRENEHSLGALQSITLRVWCACVVVY